MKERKLLDTLTSLQMHLQSIHHDLAILEVRDSLSSAKRAKKAMLLHQRDAQIFKRELEELRKEILHKRSGTKEKVIEELSESDDI